MKRSFLSLFAVCVAVGVVAVPRDAHALGPVDLEVGVKGGVGTQPSNTSPGPNILGFGLGGRGGVSFLGIYGGVNVMYYFGGSQDGTSVHSLMYGVEAGYGFKLIDIITIRPQIGIGNFTGTVSPSGEPSSSNSNLYLEPGVTGLVSLGTLFVGADANLLVLPGISYGNGQSNTDTAFTLHAQVGVKF
jgi:hypothetical protein